jgi:hypothetical protein
VQRQHGRGEGDGKVSVHGGDLRSAGRPGEDEPDGGARQFPVPRIRTVVVQTAPPPVPDGPQAACLVVIVQGASGRQSVDGRGDGR